MSAAVRPPVSPEQRALMIANSKTTRSRKKAEREANELAVKMEFAKAKAAELGIDFEQFWAIDSERRRLHGERARAALSGKPKSAQHVANVKATRARKREEKDLAKRIAAASRKSSITELE